VSSIKGATGHLLGASGAIEAVATALSVARGALPPTVNLEAPDPACDLDHVRGGPRAVRIRAALSNSFAFGGHNLSLLFGPPSTAAHRYPGEGHQ
jgi:3-oxoacyl-[acyl-carrier-protein] synthase II